MNNKLKHGKIIKKRNWPVVANAGTAYFKNKNKFLFLPQCNK
jgi:hypothetical protein